jgi:hypothetical protein
MPSNRPDQRVDDVGSSKVYLFEDTTTANQQLWDICVSGGVLMIRTRTNADGAGVTAMSFTRSGTTVPIVALLLASVPAAADDAAAAALTPAVPVGGLYRTASAVKIRVS